MTFRNIQVVMSANTTNLSSGLYKAANEVDRFNNKVQGGTLKNSGHAKLMGAAFLAAGTAVAVGLGYGVVKAAAFEKAMRNVNSLVGASEATFKQMEAQVIGMSTRLPQSAQTLAEGLYEISSSGFLGADGLKILEASATAASAGLTDTDTAAKAITATLNAYGLQASDAGDVSDTLFQTVNLGVISFGELSGVIGDVVGTAAAAKVGIDQVGSAIATMTLSGISGAEAGTSLNRVLQSIIDPSKALDAQLGQLGYESGAQALETDGLAKVMENLRQATGGNITTLLQLFPEIRAARGALALMANEGKNYTRVSAGIEDADARHGATLKVLHEQMKAASNQLQLFKNQADAVAISAGTKLLPALIGLMGAAGQLGSLLGSGLSAGSEMLAPVWADLADTAQNLWDIAAGLVEVLGPVAVALTEIVAVPIVTMLAQLASVLASLTGFAADHREIVLALAAAYVLFNTRALAIGAVKLYSGALVGLINGMSALLGSTEAAAGGFRGLQAAQVAATAGIALVVGGAIQAWMKYNEVSDQAAKVVGQTNGAIAQGSVTALDKQKKALEDTRASLEATIASYTKASFISQFWQTFSGGASAAVAASNALDEIDAAIGKVDVSSQKAGENIARFLTETMSSSALSSLAQDGEAYRAKVQEIGNQVASAGGQVSGGYDQMKAALDRYAASHSPAEVAEKELISSMGDLAGAAGDTTDAVKTLKNALDELIGGPLNQDESLIKWEQSLDDLTKSVKDNGTSLDVHTQKGRDNRSAIIDSVSALKDKTIADAEAGVSSDILAARLDHGSNRLIKQGHAAGIPKKAMRELIAQYGLTPELVATAIKATGTEGVKAQVASTQAAIDALHGKQVDISAMVRYFTSGPPPPGVGSGVGVLLPQQKRADGGVDLPGSATMARDGANLVQWAEQGTGGEAFIPLGASKRKRSTALLEQVAAMFGLSVSSFAGGGTTKKKADKPSAAEARSARQDRTSAGAATSYAGAVSKIVRRHDDGGVREITNAIAAIDKLNSAYQLQTSLIGQNAAQRKKTMAEAAAQHAQERLAAKLNIAQNKATWQFDHMTSKQQVANIDARLKHEKRYSDEWMSLQSQKASILAEQAAAAAEAAAAAQKLADNQRDWAFDHMTQQQQIATLDARLAATQPFSDEWMDAARQRESILQDIAEAERAAAEAAAEHAKMLTDNKAAWEFDHMTAQQQIADLDRRIALTEKYSDDWLTLSRQREDLARDPDREEALGLAGILSSKPGLGIVGLSQASGKGIADVVGYLERYWADIFGPLGTAAAIVASDRARIEKGLQPSGMARGGIVNGSGTGMHYRWAEPGTGGESLIPLGTNNRNRSLDIWAETGRMLGVRPSTPSGGGGVMVAAGAVQVNVDVSGTDLTPADVQRASQAAVDSAFAKMVVRIRAGRS